MQDTYTTFLFTDIEGSTRLWEQEPERMRMALARHDAIARTAVAAHGGELVKMTGDGVHAAFARPLDAVRATLELQHALVDPTGTGGVALQVRCGLHAGVVERRDNDFYGTAVNRAARIMSTAHGGQMLLSESVARHLDGSLPDGVSLRDLGVVRLRDLASPERLYQLVHPALRSDFPALRSLEETPNNLPLQLSSFVGRGRELSQLHALLAANRLVTVVGMGGLGKTRLAVHAAAEALETHSDGVWLVELAPLQESRSVPHAVATTLGVKEEVGYPIEEALARFVKDRRLLIVLDNCEHVLAGSAAIARRLLSVGPGVGVLATSREPLRIAGEAIYPVTGLSVPGPLAALSPAALEQYESVRLFVERAASALPGFALNDDNCTTIAAICSRLDGIPLAIELAAARVRSVSIPQIAARLNDRFRLLTSGDPTAAPKQRTLRAMIDWSHDMLPDAERAVFRRLSAFAGGCTLVAAERVCSDDDVQADGVLDALSRLVEKSLLLVDASQDRYFMLETVRQYATQRLAESGEAERIADRHLRYFVDFVEAARPHLAGPDQVEWLTRIDSDRENIAVAHANAGRTPGFAQEGLRLVVAMKLYWAHRGQLELGHSLTEEALARTGAREPNALRGMALFNLGQFRYFMGRYDEARASLEESLAITRASEDAAVVLPRVLQTLGMAALGQGDAPAARRWLEEAVVSASGQPDKLPLAGALTALAMLLRVEGQFMAARPLYQQVVSLARDMGDSQSESIGLLNLAMVCLECDDLGAALHAVRKVATFAAEAGSAQAWQSLMEVCAGIAAMQGEWAQAARFYGAAEASAERTGARRDKADERFLQPRMLEVRRRLGEGPFAAATQEGFALEAERARMEARAWLERVPAVSAA